MLTRRGVLQSAGLAALASCTGATPMRDEEIPIVDTHQHLWDLSKQRVPWLGKTGPLARSFTMADYLDATRGLPMKAVYMEVDVAPEDKAAEAELVIGYCEDPSTPTKGAVIGGRVADPAFPAYLDRFKGSRWIKGVRQVLHAGLRGACLKDDFLRGVRLLGARGLLFDVCIRPGELDDAVRLAELCPDTRLILDHCGNADPKAFTKGVPTAYQRSINALAARPNVVCKISGIIARVPPGAPKAELLAPVIDTCLDAFGPDRVVFGSDWPVCLSGGTLLEWVTALREVIARRPLPDRRKLWHANAGRLYAL